MRGGGDGGVPCPVFAARMCHAMITSGDSGQGCTSGRVYCTLYLHVCQVRVTLGASGLRCCTCVTCFER